MRNSVRGLVFTAALMLAAPLVQAEEIKVGFVNVTGVLEKASQADASRKKLETEFAPRDRELVKAQKEYKKLEEKMARDGAVMGDAERQELEKQMRAQQRELARMQREFREDFNIRRNEELRKLQGSVVEAIVGLAKDGGYDLILSDGVAFASTRVDLTGKVIERLNSKAKAAPSK